MILHWWWCFEVLKGPERQSVCFSLILSKYCGTLANMVAYGVLFFWPSGMGGHVKGSYSEWQIFRMTITWNNIALAVFFEVQSGYFCLILSKYSETLENMVAYGGQISCPSGMGDHVNIFQLQTMNRIKEAKDIQIFPALQGTGFPYIQPSWLFLLVQGMVGMYLYNSHYGNGVPAKFIS